MSTKRTHSVTLLAMKSVIVGTSGHIDHGKTSLVRALTGIDTDRLAEEKRRGITIDLGFAHLDLPGPNGERLRLGFVDVPGHERFVRNMLAGIGGIDLVLLVIAADEAIKPQTREHFDICRLLSVRRGITVLTKSDLVDADTLEVVRLEVAEFLRGSFLDSEQNPIISVSARTGAGLEELKKTLAQAASEILSRDSSTHARLPIDRVFTMKGFGTVVTGTLIAGSIRKEAELEVFPTGRRVRVRGVQVNGQPDAVATAGQRTALNLAGVATEDLARGMMLAPPGILRSTSRVDVSLTLLGSAKPLKDGARVHLHAHTAECIAGVILAGRKRLSPGETAYARLQLAHPALLLPGDRFILRQFSPVVTIGGGVIVDANPLDKKLSAASRNFAALSGGSVEEILLARVTRRGANGLSMAEAIAETGWAESQVTNVATALRQLGRIVEAHGTFIAREAFTEAEGKVVQIVTAFHTANPLAAGMGKELLREQMRIDAPAFAAILAGLARTKKIEAEGDHVRLPGRGVVLKDEEAESKQLIEEAFAGAGLSVPAMKDVLSGLKVDRARAQQIVTLLLRDKTLVKLSDDLVFHKNALDRLRQQVAEYKSKSPKIDVARFKEMTGVSRKYAIPLLEYLDRERITRRIGDERIIL